MNTELVLDTNRTSLKHHRKYANDNRFTDLAEIIVTEISNSKYPTFKLMLVTTGHIKIHGLHHYKDGMNMLLKHVDMMLKK